MAAAVIIAHNHPSGVSKISREDIKFTENLISGGKIMGIPVLDHVVIASEGSISMMEEHPAMFNKKLF
jgi:DNA repair protein RadC